MKVISNRSGITILETIIVLIIGGLIISGIWVAYAEMSLNDKVRRTIIAIDKTSATTRDFLATYNAVPTDLSERLYNQNLMPSELVFDRMVGAVATFRSPLNADFHVIHRAGSNRMFFIRVAFRRASAECPRLVTNMLGNIRLARERGIVGYSLGSFQRGEQQPGIPVLTADDLPEPSEIIQQCASSNAIGFYIATRS